MIILVTSPSALKVNGQVSQAIADVFKQVKAQNNPVGVISNHTEPAWFNEVFNQSGVRFIQERGRQNGEIVRWNAKKHNLDTFDALVLASTEDDLRMGKNGKAVVIVAGWSTDPRVSALGIKVESAQELKEVIDLTAAWQGDWWFSGSYANYSVCALANLSSYGQDYTQAVFSKNLTATVKNGGSKLTALLTTTARSLLKDGAANQKDLIWGVYPSSISQNNDSEVLSDFTHRLRTTVSLARYAKKNEPLFIRHTASTKRSATPGGNRTDPTEQVRTIHLNPNYKKIIKGRNAIIIDDCTTYGVSFGVAAAFLKKAGAASVKGVALGKFGSRLRHYKINLRGDPFSPVTDFTCAEPSFFKGDTNAAAQQSLKDLI